MAPQRKNQEIIERLIKLSSSNSFFLFGPRSVGKTTLVKNRYGSKKNGLYIDLLSPREESLYLKDPNILEQKILAHPNLKWVIIDEVQKIPKLLNLVHKLIEETSIQFILSGSSARKLKRGEGDLLGGRAFHFNLYPLTSLELKKKFDLKEALEWGTLPKITKLKTKEQKEEYLDSYVWVYLKEEIQLEQIIRKIPPFQMFLEIAAQMNGKILNYSKVARSVGVTINTIQSYYQILEDTLMGHYLHSSNLSVRKRQKSSPKFYLFDTGVCRALKGHLGLPLLAKTSAYGEAFEHFIVLEFFRLAKYYRKKNWRFSYLMTQENLEIDLIVTRPREKTLCLEIKSSKEVTKDDVKTLNRLGSDIPNSLLYCVSRDEMEKKIEKVHCLHWERARDIFFK